MFIFYECFFNHVSSFIQYINYLLRNLLKVKNHTLQYSFQPLNQ
jgi:hypothetical protein